MVTYLEELGYEVHSVSLDVMSLGRNFDRAEYLYARKVPSSLSLLSPKHQEQLP